MEEGLDPERVLPGLKPERTSKPEVKPQGFSEPTATIVWKALLGCGFSATDFVLWNAFPWHPFDEKLGLLSNRKPNSQELRSGDPFLRWFLSLVPECCLIAVGRAAAERLSALDLAHAPVRHPAQGGAAIFRRQIRSILP
jgi:hypothetical protein